MYWDAGAVERDAVLNANIVLPTSHAESVRNEFGYGADECLSTEKVLLYVANGKALTPTGKQRKGSSTLERVEPDTALGLAVEIFDSTIIEMGKVQDALRYGAI